MIRSLRVLVCLPLLLVSCRAQKISLPKDVQVISREQWGAKAPVLSMKQHVPDRITIHHTATQQHPDKPTADKLRGLQSFSQSKSTLGSGRVKEIWADIPYHFYIAANGEIAEGRELRYVGDSNTPYDPTGHALIVLEGNFQHEEVTSAQLGSLRKLISSLSKKFHIGPDRMSGHKDNADTLCPGDKLYALIPELKLELVAGQQ